MPQPQTHISDGTTRKAKELHVCDGGGVVRKVKEAWYHDGAAVRKVFAGFTLPGGNFSADTDVAPAGHYAGVQFFSDGTVEANTNSVTTAGVWGVPTTAGIGAGFYVRFTKTSGSGSVSSPAGMLVWQQLSTTRMVTMSGAVGTVVSAVVLYEIAETAGGTVVASGNIALAGDFTI